MSTSLLMGVFFVALLFAGVPIVVCLALSSVAAIVITGQYSLSLIAPMMFSGMNSFVLVAVPLFMLAGNLMNEGGIVHKIFDVANAAVGWMNGGLGHVNVLASMIFGGISGSSVADAAGLGPIEIKAMTEFGYPKDYSAAITVASSTLAVIIPPSIMTIIYAVSAEVSIGRCLIAGVIPGALLGLGMMGVNWLYARKNGWGTKESFSISTIWERVKDGIWALLTPVLILAGLFSGVFTPTEASGITALYTLFISLFIYKTVRLTDLPAVLLNTAKDAGVALAVISMASIPSFILTAERVPDTVANWLLSLTGNPYVILVLIILMLLVVGMFMSTTIALIILTPMFLPAITSLGIDPVHFGIVMVASLAVGLITPPVGSCLFITSTVAKVPIEKITLSLIPFYVCIFITLLLIAFVPWFSLWLPNIMFG